MKNLVFRGILIGASVGVMLSLAGLGGGIGQAFFVGGACGALAGYTMWRRQKKR